jgi:uncharacterized protein
MQNIHEFITTATGKRFWPLDPRAEQVELAAIAGHLSKMCRWSGAIQGDDVYSVAQHAVYVSYLCDPAHALEGLHHDSSEAYLVDVARPVKHAPGFMEVYKRHEAAITAVIFQAFGINETGEMHPSVKIADNRMLVTEAQQLMPEPVDGWEPGLNFADVYDFRITVWSPREARHRFTRRHNELMEARMAA